MIALQRMPAFIAAGATLLFIIALLHQHHDNIPVAKSLFKRYVTPSIDYPSPHNQLILPSSTKNPPSFFEIATKHGTDKVSTHSYQDMYEKYFPPLRHQPLKMLEIGLGCNMNYGPGASYYTWLEYFPHVDLYYIEYDAACAATWANKTTGATIFTGDQADVAFLNKFIAEAGVDFDIIIDDGGHTMHQQKTSLKHLYQIVKPGGLYFCEDLQTSYEGAYGGGDVAKAKGELTMVQFIAQMIEDLSVLPRRQEFEHADQVSHIDCSREVCVFEKKKTRIKVVVANGGA